MVEIILLKLQEQKFHSLSIIFGKKDQTLIKRISIQVIVAVQVWTAKVLTACLPSQLHFNIQFSKVLCMFYFPGGKRLLLVSLSQSLLTHSISFEMTVMAVRPYK